jgi:hypothetical protein
MTLTAMEDDGNGAKATIPPIVLTLDCPDVQTYLVPENDVLSWHFNTKMIRINLKSEERKWLKFYIFPQHHDSRVYHAQASPTVSWADQEEWTNSQQFIHSFQDRMSSFIKGHPLLKKVDDDVAEAAVRTVLISQDLVPGNGQSTLWRLFHEGFLPLFPSAQYYKVGSDRKPPERLWTPGQPFKDTWNPRWQEALPGDGPLCTTCLTKMRPAGPEIYVCEGCGSTAMHNPGAM